MLSTESRRGRRILARIDRGTDLFDGLRALCQKHQILCAEVRGIGTLELVELTVFDQAARRWKPPRVVSGGGMELLQLQGNISEENGAVSIEARATLLRDGGAGVEVFGGQLLRAVAYSLELVVETFDDVLLRRQLEPSLGLSRWIEALSEADTDPTPPPAAPRPALPVAAAPPRPIAPVAAPARPAAPAAPARPAVPAAPPPAASQPTAPPARASAPTLPPPNPNPIQTTTARPVVPSSISSAPPRRDQTTSSDREVESATPTPSWADVAAASQSPAQASGASAEASEEDVQINAGDVILHPRFQRCVVHRVEHSGDYVQVMLRNGRVVRLSLEVLRLTPQGIENGQRIFSATVL